MPKKTIAEYKKELSDLHIKHSKELSKAKELELELKTKVDELSTNLFRINRGYEEEKKSNKTLRYLLNTADKDVIRLKLMIADEQISKKLPHSTITHKLSVFEEKEE